MDQEQFMAWNARSVEEKRMDMSDHTRKTSDGQPDMGIDPKEDRM